jgi:RNA polymerase sigma-70 factor (ECF subfamily)
MLARDRTPDRKHVAVAIAHHHADLIRRARQLVGREEADDLVQNTVEKALRHLQAFTPETNLLAWLRRIMANLMIDDWRRQKRRHTAIPLDADQLPAPPADDDEQTPPTPPWQRLCREDVVRAVPLLTRYVRPVFALHLLGLSYRQIAARLGLRPATVGTRLLRARLQMRRLLAVTVLEREHGPANDVSGPDLQRSAPTAPPASRAGRKARKSPTGNTGAAAPVQAQAGLAG